MGTTRDVNQVIKLEHDEKTNAKRVILVGGEKLELNVDSDKITSAIKESLENLKLPEVKTQEITTVTMGS